MTLTYPEALKTQKLQIPAFMFHQEPDISSEDFTLMVEKYK